MRHVVRPLRANNLTKRILVSWAGLVPAIGLAERAGLAALVRGHVTIAAAAG